MRKLSVVTGRMISLIPVPKTLGPNMSQPITKTTIEAYLKLLARKRELQRRAKALDKEADKIEDQLVAFVRANGGKARSVTRSGYVLALGDKAGSVAWKAAYIEVAGQDAAEKLIAAAAAESSEVLSVEPVARGRK